MRLRHSGRTLQDGFCVSHLGHSAGLEGLRWCHSLAWGLGAGASSFLHVAPQSSGPLSPGPLSAVEQPDFFMWLKPASGKVEAGPLYWPIKTNHRAGPDQGEGEYPSIGRRLQWPSLGIICLLEPPECFLQPSCWVRLYSSPTHSCSTAPSVQKERMLLAGRKEVGYFF